MRPARVLVVDDEPALRAVAREALSRAGFTVLLAASGEEALACLRAEGGGIDVVLLDLTMPGLSGTDAVRAIHAEAPALPVVLTSGYPEEEVAAVCGGERCAGFISKPFSPAALVAAIGRMVVQRGRA